MADTALVPFPNHVKELNRGSTCGLKQGDMQIQSGKACPAVEADVELTVASTGVIPALNAAQRLTVLDSFGVTFIDHLGKNGPTLKPIQGESLKAMRDDAKALLEEDFEGVDDATTGLAQAFTAGTFILKFTALIALAAAEAIKGSKDFMGLGAEQLLDCSLTIKGPTADIFKAVNAGLTLTKMQVAFTPRERKVDGYQIGIPVHVETYVDKGSQSIETKEGLPIRVDHMSSALAATAIRELTVDVGANFTATAPPNTPAEITAAFEAGPDSGTVEESIKLTRTPILVNGDGNLTSWPVGKVTAKQDKLLEEWNLRQLYIPYLSKEERMALCETVAARLPAKMQLLVVNAARFTEVKVLDAHRPYTGMRGFDSNDPRFYTHSGIRIESGKKGVVYIPKQERKRYARQLIEVMKSSRDYPGGDLGAASAIYQEAARDIPGAQDPEGKYEGTWVMEEVERILKAEVREVEQELLQLQARIAGKAA